MAEIVNVVDFDKLGTAVERCCKTLDECNNCQSYKCLIGFGKMVVKYAQNKNIYNIRQGEEMVPRGDYKVFDREPLIEALAETCVQCKNCNDSHDENCSVSLIRNALENALLGQNISYAGSSGLYIMEVGKLDQGVGAELMANFLRFKTRN